MLGAVVLEAGAVEVIVEEVLLVVRWVIVGGKGL